MSDPTPAPAAVNTHRLAAVNTHRLTRPGARPSAPDDIFVIYSALEDAISELRDREDDTDYWLDAEDVVARREQLQRISDLICGAHAIVIETAATA